MTDLFSSAVSTVADSEPFRERFAQESSVLLEHVCAQAQSFVAACATKHFSARCWLICSDVRRQEEIYNDLLSWKVDALFFPELETPRIEGALPDAEIVAERLDLLRQIVEAKRDIVVLTKASLADEVPSPEGVQQRVLVLRQGDLRDREKLVGQLVAAGFESVSQVTARSQFAVRGGILDVFAPQHSLPVRLEFFGDMLESIREFDLDEQTSIQRVEQCELLMGEPGGPTQQVREYIRPGDVMIDVEANVDSAKVRIMSGAAASSDRPENFSTAFFESGFQDFEAGDFLVEEAKRELALKQLREWISDRWNLLAICHNEGEIERLRDVLTDNEIEVDKMRFAVGALNHGFTYPAGRFAVLCDAEIFGRYQSPSAQRLALRRSRLRSSRAPIDFSELSEGDLVVHLEYGIGRFLGIRQIVQNGARPEVVALEFANEARLYVPFEQAFLISRYVGIGKRYPPLSTLGDSRWANAKKAAENAVFDYAAKLLSLQAERNTLTGFAFPPDTKWQREFESSFLFKETPDQLRAIDETKRDMESRQPMDRLICGDVGFGKTEVAIRAAFKAAMSGKQVAMLVPTTVLAQQHFNTFRERMSDYPVKIVMLSRFLSQREEKKNLAELKNGSADIVVGTHRLISGDVVFKNLGLVIIDEEQRFGVRHKERFKEQFKLIDVLTLSATPIPRTLYLSLVGARDMSIIETPPPNRLPIETMICGYDERLIRDAVHRELKRRGQVYFLHNRIDSIDRVRDRIRLLCPEARTDIGHGQMEENDLEEVMRRFVSGETDVLISTTIIESGLDIPNANTIMIDRADRFGLADLYQLRGRVGRAQHRAYAYLFLPRDLMTVGAARRRINAIKQYSGLGAGFKIAMRDLEIRGAGNLLGTAQSGHIVNVGFELYCQLLQQAVEKLRGQKARTRTEVLLRLDFAVTSEAEFLDSSGYGIPAFIPSDYISQPALRIQAYKRIAEVATVEQLAQLGKHWRDRFGPLPPAAENLLTLTRLKLLAGQRQISAIEVKERKVMIRRRDDYLLIGNRFPRLTSGEPENNLTELLTLINSLT
jgi:transcription-repair coupling factor (superfamily II helicase)